MLIGNVQNTVTRPSPKLCDLLWSAATFWQLLSSPSLLLETTCACPGFTTVISLTPIILITLWNDRFLGAVKDQPSLAILGHPAIKAAAIALFASGQTFVITSMWALGVTGTYLGDYFGILMSHRVTSFPFNVLSDPMYVGSFLTHLGTALWFQSPAGIVLAAWVWIVYAVALKFEGWVIYLFVSQNKLTRT